MSIRATHASESRVFPAWSGGHPPPPDGRLGNQPTAGHPGNSTMTRTGPNWWRFGHCGPVLSEPVASPFCVLPCDAGAQVAQERAHDQLHRACSVPQTSVPSRAVTTAERPMMARSPNGWTTSSSTSRTNSGVDGETVRCTEIMAEVGVRFTDARDGTGASHSALVCWPARGNGQLTGGPCRQDERFGPVGRTSLECHDDQGRRAGDTNRFRHVHGPPLPSRGYG